MKVLVVNCIVPFKWGESDELALHLEKNLKLAGYEAETLRIPYNWEPTSGIPAQMLMIKAFELFNVDRVIALEFPAYLIRHPHKTLWLVNYYRQAYDLYVVNPPSLQPGYGGDEMQQLIHSANKYNFEEAKKIFTNSEITKKRLQDYYDYHLAEVLHPPLNDPELFCGGENGGYIFAGGRVNQTNRQFLLIEALALVPTAKLIIAGRPDTVTDAELLHKLVEKYSLQDRVKLDLRLLSREEHANYVNQSTAVAYLPDDKGSFGYLLMEAATAAKAIITCNDNDGCLALIKNLETGWVCAPKPTTLAEAISSACTNWGNAKNLGKSAQELWQTMGVSWQKTIKRLMV